MRSLTARAVRIALLSLTVALLAGGPAYGSYDAVQGGVASPSTVTAGGQTTYSVSLTGRPAIVDVVLVLDNSGSMATDFGGQSRWSTLASQSNAFVDSLNSSGLFTRGGRVGVVLFSDAATTAASPTTDVSAIKAGIASGAPDSNSCIGCGIERATDLLKAIPGGASHRQIVYLVADGANTVTPPTLADAVAGSNAAHIERRVIGISASAMNNGLESIDSNGSVPYATTASEISQDYAADPTAYPGATNVSWTFHVTPGFSPSSPTVSDGSASVTGQDVTWTLPGLGAHTATLSFNATHDPAAGCSATSLLSGTAFSDAEGDAAPAAGLGALSLTGCDADGDGIPDSSDACPIASDRAAPRSPRDGCPLFQPTNGNDKLSGNGLANVICGLLGNDTLNGLGGNDTLWGDLCNDKTKSVFGAAAGKDGNDVLNGGDGNDKLYGAGGNDTLNGGKGNDKLFGGGGNDKLNGGPGTNTYSGGPGNDTINARNGKKETVDCGSGKKDSASVDKKDKTKGCEKVKRAKK